MSSFKKKSNLVIFVADYPYGTGEPFLEEELKVISGNFNKIYLVNFIEDFDIKPREIQFYVPENAQVISYNLSKKKIAFSDVLFIQPLVEFFMAIVKHNKKLNLSLVKLIFFYWRSSTARKDKMDHFIQENNIDLSTTYFYSYWCDLNALALARISIDNKLIKFVTRLHGWDLYFDRHSLPFLPFRELIFNQAYRIFPISNDGRKYILNKKLSIRKEKVIVSYLGVGPLERNIYYKSINEQSDSVFRIVTLSHINRIKSLHRLVEAICLIDSFEIKWKHIGYGDGVFDVEFKKYVIDKLGGKKNVQFEFTGRLAKVAVLEILQNEPINVIVNCSTTEGIPVSLMEAMSVGVPAIALNVGGIAEIVKDEFNGFLLDNSTENCVINLKNAIVRFQKLSIDEQIEFSTNSISVWQNKFNSTENFSNFSNFLTNDPEIEKIKISCDKCLVDSDIYPGIVLDKFGVCDVCSVVESKNLKLQNQRYTNYLENLLSEIKRNKKSNKYDCIIGISGGVDSAYLATKASEWGLNPLLVHIDNGWNSEIAVHNVQLLIEQLNLDLYTVVIDWKEIQDVVKSFLKASVIDIDWANEMCSQASLNIVAKKFGVKHILTGHQMATEGWMPDNVVHYKLDSINFRAIHKKFGERKLKTYPVIGFLKTYYYEKIAGIKFYFPLDYIEYNKENVKIDLIEKYGWKDYGQKHFESIFTRFYQGYILIEKFKIDKRKFHYSSSILSGQMTKQEALDLVSSNEYILSGQMQQDKEYVIKKLGFTKEEFENILNEKPKSHLDYPSLINIINKLRKIKNVIQNNR